MLHVDPESSSLHRSGLVVVHLFAFSTSVHTQREIEVRSLMIHVSSTYISHNGSELVSKTNGARLRTLNVSCFQFVRNMVSS